MTKWVAAEKAIYDAMQAVEAMPADDRLTDAVCLLGQSRKRVADYVDGVLPGRCFPAHDYQTGQQMAERVATLEKTLRSLKAQINPYWPIEIASAKALLADIERALAGEGGDAPASRAEGA
jgi:hypothetical protein